MKPLINVQRAAHSLLRLMNCFTVVELMTLSGKAYYAISKPIKELVALVGLYLVLSGNACL